MPPFSHMEILMNPSILARYNRPVFFYFWSITIPWFCWFLAGYLSQLPQAADYAWLQGTLGMAGLLAPIAVAAWLFAADPLLLADLKARLFTRRGLNAPIVAFTLLFPPLSIIVAMTISLAFGYSADQFVISGSPSFSSALFSPWFILLFAALVEELAWHTYGTDTLLRRFNLFTTSIIFALFWGAWHLPLATIKGYYQANLVAEGWQYGVNFLVSVFMFVFIMNWVYAKAGRNVWIAVLFHAVANISNEIFAAHPASKIIQSGLFLLLAAYLLTRDRKLFFQRGSIA